MDTSSGFFVIEPEVRTAYAGVYVLKLLIEGEIHLSRWLKASEKPLAPILAYLTERGYVTFNKLGYYKSTSNGQDYLNIFLTRYEEFLGKFDVFCGVDLSTGEFALSYQEHYKNSHDEWQKFLSEERWEDLRIAVAEYLGFDAVELVFVSYIWEDRFGRDEQGFSNDLLLGSIWDEIQGICNCSMRLKSLSRVDENGIETQGEQALSPLLVRGLSLGAQL